MKILSSMFHVEKSLQFSQVTTVVPVAEKVAEHTNTFVLAYKVQCPSFSVTCCFSVFSILK